MFLANRLAWQGQVARDQEMSKVAESLTSWCSQLYCHVAGQAFVARAGNFLPAMWAICRQLGAGAPSV
jgi:hypothetical protein